MKVARGLGEVTRDPGSVVTVGTFDGVHLAHREIVREVVHRALMRETRSVVVSFDPHPRQVLGNAGGGVELLTTVDERIDLLGSLQVQLLVLLPFTRAFSLLTPREFFTAYIVKGTGVGEVVVGYNHMFGRDRTAGVEDLVRMGQEFSFSVFGVHPYTADGEPVSSTAIRAALSAGDVERAANLLGYEYALTGRVVRGAGRGRTLGYPTANIVPGEPLKLVPGNGVYLVGVRRGNEQLFGMMNIGVRPTVSAAAARVIEVHLFGFDGDLYGEEVTVSFLRRLREERPFGSLEELTRQLGQDREASLRLLAEQGRR